MDLVRITVSHIHKMKTSILDEMNLPEDAQAVARREAMRRECPVSEVLKDWVLEKARAIKAGAAAAAQPNQAAA